MCVCVCVCVCMCVGIFYQSRRRPRGWQVLSKPLEFVHPVSMLVSCMCACVCVCVVLQEEKCCVCVCVCVYGCGPPS